MCTYKLRRESKRKGLGDYWRVKWGLTRCDRGRERARARRGPLLRLLFAFLASVTPPLVDKTKAPQVSRPRTRTPRVLGTPKTARPFDYAQGRLWGTPHRVTKHLDKNEPDS